MFSDQSRLQASHETPAKKRTATGDSHIKSFGNRMSRNNSLWRAQKGPLSLSFGTVEYQVCREFPSKPPNLCQYFRWPCPTMGLWLWSSMCINGVNKTVFVYSIPEMLLLIRKKIRLLFGLGFVVVVILFHFDFFSIVATFLMQSKVCGKKPAIQSRVSLGSFPRAVSS